MQESQQISETIYCKLCNRPVLIHDIDLEAGIVYCYGCNYYFPLTERSGKGRDEIVIPKGTDFIRLRILRDELELKMKWNRNYQVWKELNDKRRKWPQFFITLAYVFNSTTVEVQSGYIKIDHSPIDIVPMSFYASTMIEQLYVKQIQEKGWITERDMPFGLYVNLKSGRNELLVWGLKKSTLLFIEQEIERVLKIKDVA